MKQTIRTKNYNATIQIPYEKLAKKSNYINLQNLQCQNQQQNYTKTIIIPHCNGCCQQTTSNTGVTMGMLQELQVIFQNDMKQKDSRIKVLEDENLWLKSQLTENKKQIQNYKIQINNFNRKQDLLEKSLKDHQGDIQRLRKQIQLAQAQKQKILRTKIAQFQNSYLQYKKNQAQKIAKLQAESQNKLKQQISNLNLKFQQQKSQLKQQLSQYRLKNQYEKANFDRQKQLLQNNLKQLTNKIPILQHKIQQNQLNQRNYLSTINGRQSQLKQYQNTIKQLQKKMSNLYEIISQIQNSNKILVGKLSSTQSLYHQLQQKYSVLDSSHKNIYTVSHQYQIKIKQANKNIQQLLANIEELKRQLSNKESELHNKDNPKLYEVKIQKVIDRRQYIERLQKELQEQRKIIFNYTQKIKQFQRIFISKQKQLQQKLLKIVQLEEMINKLKAYIQQKQKSFAWIVERQITKDIQLNQKQTNRTYKVYPSQPVFTSPAPYVAYNIPFVTENKKNYNYHQQLKIQDVVINGVQRYIDSPTILQQLQENNQFSEVIKRGVQYQGKITFD